MMELKQWKCIKSAFKFEHTQLNRFDMYKLKIDLNFTPIGMILLFSDVDLFAYLTVGTVKTV